MQDTPTMVIVPEKMLTELLQNQQRMMDMLAKMKAEQVTEDELKTVFNRKEALGYINQHMKMSMNTFADRVRYGIIKTSPASSRHYLKKELDEYLKNPR